MTCTLSSGSNHRNGVFVFNFQNVGFYEEKLGFYLKNLKDFYPMVICQPYWCNCLDKEYGVYYRKCLLQKQIVMFSLRTRMCTVALLHHAVCWYMCTQNSSVNKHLQCHTGVILIIVNLIIIQHFQE